MKISRLKLLLLIIWGICGLFVFLSGEASLFSFGCAWLVLMYTLFDSYRNEKRQEDDDS
jgi:hypothetical protein